MEVSTQFLADLIDPDSGVPLEDVLILRVCFSLYIVQRQGLQNTYVFLK